MRKLVATLAVAAVALGLTACGPSQHTKDLMAFYTNVYRSDNGLGQLNRDDPTAMTAQVAANRIRDENGSRGCRSLNHGNLNTLNSVLAGSSVSENIACAPGCNDAAVAQMLTKWRNSQQHHANWLNPIWTAYGVGLACNGNTAFGVVQFHN